MPEPVTISIVAIYVAKKIVEKIVVEQSIRGLGKIFFPRKKYVNRLSKLINANIEEFRKSYKEHDSKGDFYFFDSEIILSELFKHVVFKTKYDYDYKELKEKFKKFPRIIIPTDKELLNFFNSFIEKVNSDNKLRELHIDEYYKEEIFNISTDLKALIEITESIKDKLDDNDEEILSIFYSNNPLNRFISKTTPLDIEILEAIRNNTSTNNRERYYQVYQNGIDSLNKAFIKHSLGLINKNSIDIKFDKPDISVEIKLNDFAKFYSGEEELTITKPNLLWDCNCKIKFPKKYNKRKCPIHSEIEKNGLGKNLETFFTSGLVNIKSSGINVYWRNQKNLWPPSADSMYLIEDIKNNGYCTTLIEDVIDIGCGTGYLGLWLAKNNNHIKELHFTDWLLLPLIFSYINSKQNNLGVDCFYHLGLNVSWLAKQEGFKMIDLAVCNPPYLPFLTGNEKFKNEMTVAGTELLSDFITNWHLVAKEAIISFSHIALPEAILASETGNVKLTPLGDKRLIPFRVNAAYSENRYISRLLREDRIVFRRNNQFPYWHHVQTYKLEKSASNRVDRPSN
jgi:hypothetical protein